MTVRLRVFPAFFGLLMVVVPLAAQYSFFGTYDENRPVKLSGMIAAVEWGNPHSHIYLDVTSADGSVVRWILDLAGSRVLSLRGMRKATFNSGDLITVEGFKTRNDERRAYSRTIAFQDGEEVNTEPDTVWGGCRTVAGFSIEQYSPSAVFQNQVCASVVR